MIKDVRSIQKTGTKELGGKLERSRTSGARYLLLRPAGYPLKSVFQDYPEVADPRLFERYAREQWYGELVRPGCYLFDRRLYPDFAFKVIRAHPHVSVVGSDTKIVVEKKKTEAAKIKSEVSFDDIVGQKEARRKMKIVESFLSKPERFGKWAPRNILFYGPSGTGKTMMAKALSGETKVPMIPIKATTLIGEFVGEGSRQIHGLYKRAEEMAPCIIFIDELDAIALDRRYQDLRGDVSEVVNALLTEMDGIHSRKGSAPSPPPTRSSSSMSPSGAGSRRRSGLASRTSRRGVLSSKRTSRPSRWMWERLTQPLSRGSLKASQVGIWWRRS